MCSILNIKWVIKNIHVTSEFNTQIIRAGISGWKGVDIEKWKLFWKVSGNLKKPQNTTIYELVTFPNDLCNIMYENTI